MSTKRGFLSSHTDSEAKWSNFYLSLLTRGHFIPKVYVIFKHSFDEEHVQKNKMSALERALLVDFLALMLSWKCSKR